MAIKTIALAVLALGTIAAWPVHAEVPTAADFAACNMKAAEGAAGGTVTVYEEIRDGTKKLTAYHVKKDENGIKWKIALSPEGTVQFVRREMKAEIEVTVR